MRKTLTTVVLGAALLGLAISAYAAPSLVGYTGLLVIPNADSLSKGSFNVGFANVDVAGDDLNNFFLNYGLDSGSQAALEVGLNIARPENAEKNTYINAKCTFQKETMGKTGIAAGVIDATDTTETTLYVVGSKVLQRGPVKVFNGEVLNPRVHFGIAAGGIDGLFAGLSANLGNRLTLMAEHDSSEFHVGAKLFINRGLAVEAGWMDVGGNDDLALGGFYSVSY